MFHVWLIYTTFRPLTAVGSPFCLDIRTCFVVVRRLLIIDPMLRRGFADAPSQAPGLQRKKSRMSVMFNEMHHVPHDDEIGVETSWHDLHGGSFHRLSQKHQDHVHRRLSSMGPVVPTPTDISTYAF